MNEPKLVIFDLDDTLVDTSHVYWVARKRFSDTVKQQGVSENVIIDTFEHLDAENIKKFGLIPSRYGITMSETYDLLAERYHFEKHESILREIEICGDVVLNSLPKLIPGAMELLKWISTRFDTILLTRGIPELQHKKIESRRIAHFFRYIRIVPHKSSIDFEQVVKKSGFDPKDAWAIGDSIRSDINPALQAGLNAILYRYTHHSYYWRQEYGVTPSGSFVCVDRLKDIKKVLEAPGDVNLTTPDIWSDRIKAEFPRPK
ncbi:HAD family hydrolase [Paraburkholderia nemoris]|uniref:HAD family hydrolase n=1 Tax=Paraburkholderia nemoris TaxID=2793076 RepID=UPI0038BB30A6